jgi:site-specific DNA-cytosine methylase
MTQYNVLELFGGCGGLGWGFKKEGFTISAYNELDPKISTTYKENFKGTKCIIGDITNPTIKQQIYDCFESLKCNIILGGVLLIQCQDIEIQEIRAANFSEIILQWLINCNLISL